MHCLDMPKLNCRRQPIRTEHEDPETSSADQNRESPRQKEPESRR